jgi:hypothetical protein
LAITFVHRIKGYGPVVTSPAWMEITPNITVEQWLGVEVTQVSRRVARHIHEDQVRHSV